MFESEENCAVKKYTWIVVNGNFDGKLQISKTLINGLCLARDIMGSDVCRCHDLIDGHQVLEHQISPTSGFPH